MSNPEDIASVDRTAEVEHAIKMGEALNRLRQNPDFQTLILDGYLKDKALASVSLLAVPQIKEQGRRTDIMEDLVASSNLEYFFSMVDNQYLGAKDPVLSDEEQAELEKEQAEGATH